MPFDYLQKNEMGPFVSSRFYKKYSVYKPLGPVPLLVNGSEKAF